MRMETPHEVFIVLRALVATSGNFVQYPVSPEDAQDIAAGIFNSLDAYTLAFPEEDPTLISYLACRAEQAVIPAQNAAARMQSSLRGGGIS